MTIQPDDLMRAILAMDSYNQGYRPGLTGVGTQIGSATVSTDSTAKLGLGATQSVGFYAVAYQLNGQTVIAYRGTDILPGRNGAAIFDSASWQDFAAWSLTFGNDYSAAQALLAQSFYDQVRNSAPGQQIVTTGHSLGGALAGFMASIHGLSAWAYDPMGYTGAANALYDATTIGVPAGDGQSFIVDTAAAQAYYGGGPIPALNFDGIHGIALQGEIGFLARRSPVYTVPTAIGELTDNQLHDAALLVMMMYADQSSTSHTLWRQFGTPLLNALFDSTSIPTALGLDAVQGSDTPDQKLRTMIAYSAAVGDGLPFGNTSIEALFKGADELGRLYSGDQVGRLVSSDSIKKALADIDVEYAGWLAKNKDKDNNIHKSGQIAYNSDQSTLTVDFTDKYWKLDDQTLERSKIIGRQELVDAAVDQSGAATWLRSQITSKWSGKTDQLDRFVLSTVDTDPTLDGNGDSPLSDSEGALLDSGDGDDLLLGTAGNDLILGGGGNDTLKGGGGTDIIYGGDGADEIDFGGPNAPTSFQDFVDGGSGNDTISFDGDGTQGVNLTLTSIQGVGDAGNATLLQVTEGSNETVTLTAVDTVRLSDQKDTVHLASDIQNPTDRVTIDAGTQPVGTGDVLDLSNMTVAASGKAAPTYQLSKKDSFTPTGIDFDHGHLLGLDNLSFKNFEILNGTGQNDYVAYARDFKNVNLGAGDDVAGGLVGDVLPDQQGMPRNQWVRLDMGSGADTVLGGLARGSDVYLGNDHDRDKVMNVMNDVRINQAGIEDRFYILGGQYELYGGDRNVHSESAWAYGRYGVRYAYDNQGDLLINYAGNTMTISNAAADPQLRKSHSIGGMLVFDVDFSAWRLLDPNKPKISMIDAWMVGFGYMWKVNYGYSAWKGVDPLVLDLNGDGIRTIAMPQVGNGFGYGTRFDIEGNGFNLPTGWIDATDAFVVRDLNGNGRIDSVAEMLGAGVNSGFQSLAAYDYNHDGKVDVADWSDLNGNGVRDAGEGALDVLRLWKDVNGDGVTENGELLTFGEAGIASISVASQRQQNVFDEGNQILDQGSFTRADGTTGRASDVTFETDAFNSQWNPSAWGGAPQIDDRIAALPQVKGHGSLMDLHDAMALDELAADREQAAQQAASGGPVARRETLADIVERVGPSIATPELTALRREAAPVLSAWVRAVEASPPQSEASAGGGRDVLAFVKHHDGGPDEQVDYAYKVTRTVADPDNPGQTTTVMSWALGSGAAVRDASGNTIANPTFDQMIAFSPSAGGFWQYDDGAREDIAPASPADEVRLFVTQVNGHATISDYAYLVSGVVAGPDAAHPQYVNYWKIASGAPVTDGEGNTIDRPTSDDLANFRPVQGGSWETFDGANPDFAPGDRGQPLRLLVRHDNDGSDHVVDYVYSVTQIVTTGDPPVSQPLTFWQLGSGQPVLDQSGNTITHPTLAQAESVYSASSGEWQTFTDAQPVTSADAPHQGLNLFVANGTNEVLDYAYAVSETVSTRGSSDHEQVTFWRLGSGNPVRDASGNIIDRPTYEQVMASAPAAQGNWQYIAGAQPDFSAGVSTGTTYLLVTHGTDGTARVIDTASLVSRTVAVTGADGLLHAETVSSWQLASGDIVTDANGNLIADPTLDQLTQYATREGGEWQQFQGALPGIGLPPHHQGVTVFLQQTPGQAEHVADYAYSVTDEVMLPGIGGSPAQRADITYWKLGSGAAVTDANGTVIPYPTLDQILASAPANNGHWEHFEGSYIDFLESYMGNKIDIDVPGLNNSVSFSDFTSAFDQLLQRIDLVTVRLAMQTGLKPFFEDVAYDAHTDTFAPTTNRQLTPTYEGILQQTLNRSHDDALAYLANWKPILDVVIGDYSRGTGGENNYGFIFSNIATANENIGGTTPLGLVDIADALGVPRDIVIAQPGETILGTNAPDIIYVDYGNQVARAGGGLDNYIMGKDFGHDTVDDVEVYGQDTEADDVLRFTQYNVSDLTFRRENTDLVISVNGHSGQDIRIVDQFHGIMTGLLGANIDDNHGIAEFVFADGTVWDKYDLANAVSQVSPVNGVVAGTPDIDVLDGGPGADYVMKGGRDSDTYVYGRDYGNDTVDDFSDYALQIGTNLVQFKPDISSEDVTFSRNGDSDDLIVHVAGSSHALTIHNMFEPTYSAVLDTLYFNRIDAFTFTDGESDPITWEDVERQVIAAAETDGNDSVYGFHEDDTLAGGKGEDFLSGGDGSDTYLFNVGDGHDTIQDRQLNLLSGSDNKVVFGPGIRPQDVTLERSTDEYGADVTFHFAGSDDTLKIVNQFDYSTINVNFDQIQSFAFADGTVWTPADLRQLYISQVSTSGNDTIEGFWTDDSIVGGTGNDVLRGGDGSDTYYFAPGFGDDTIEETTRYITYSSNDVIEFGPGIAPDAIILTRADSDGSGRFNDLVMSVSGTTDRIDIPDEFANAAYFAPWDSIETVRFADGTTWSRDEIAQRALQQATTAGDDTIVGYYSADTLDGGAGNDKLYGRGGGDTYIFGRGYGNDTIEDRWATVYEDQPDRVLFKDDVSPQDVTFRRDDNDLVISIAGTSDTLRITSQFFAAFMFQVEQFQFADGTVYGVNDINRMVLANQKTPGNDTVLGFDGPDTLDGGAGNDSLIGAGGGDTYIFGRGYGSDTIVDNAPWDGAPDRVAFGNGIVPSDVSVSRSGDDLLIRVSGSNDLLTVRGQFASTNNPSFEAANRVELFSFANGTTWTAAQLDASILQAAETSGDDTIMGYGFGAETLDGGSGNDLMSGKTGGDTYRFGIGDGSDTIDDQGDQRGATIDTVAFKSGISPNSITLQRAGSDLVVGIDGASDRLTIKGQYSHDWSTNVIEQFTFADGTVWGASEIDRRFVGNQASSGNDTIHGLDGADTIDGLAGNDLLIGGTGADTYVFGRGSGSDRIQDQGDSSASILDNVSFASGLAPADVQFFRRGNALLVNVAGTADQLTIQRQFSSADTANRIERFVFSDGTVLSASDVASQAQLVGTDAYTYATDDGDFIIDDVAVAGRTRLRLSDLSRTQVQLHHSADGQDLLITALNTGATLRLVGELGSSASTGKIQALEFADGSVLDLSSALLALVSSESTTVLTDPASPSLTAIPGNTGYVVKLHDGNTTIQNHTSPIDPTRFDTLLLSDITPDQVAVSRRGADLFVAVPAQGSTVTVLGEFTSLNRDGVQQIEFADGTLWNRDQITAAAWYRAGSGDEVLVAQDGDATLAAGSGNDTLWGGEGSDTFVYASTNGNLRIEDHSQYEWNSTTQHVDWVWWKNGPRSNTLRLSDLNPSDIVASRSGSDLVLADATTGHSITVAGEFLSTDKDGIQQIVFANGTSWNRDQITAAAPYRAGSGDQVVVAQDGNGTLVAGSGNDTLWGGEGSDSFVYASTDGNLRIEDHSEYEWNVATQHVDWVWWKNGPRFNTLNLSDFNATDLFASRNGNDLILSLPASGRTITVAGEFLSTDKDGVQQIVFADGTSWNRDQITAAAPYRASINNHVVVAENGTATLFAGTGNDTLVGGDLNNDHGADTFVYSRADGNLDIEAHVFAWNSISNTLRLSDLSASDINLVRSNGDLQVTVKPTGKVITITGELNSTNHDGIQQIAFADGTTWTRDQIQAHAPYVAGPGNLTLTAPNGDAILIAGTGDDTLVGGDLNNNNASDTFVYQSIDGNLDVEAHVYSWNSINNTLNLTDINASGLIFTRVNNDLRITVNSTGKTITVGNEFASTNHDGVQQIAFADGTVWNRAQITSHSPYRAGPGGVTMTLVDGDVAFAAGSGNDTVIAGDMWNNASDDFFYSAANGNLDIEAHVYSWNAINNTLNLTDINASGLIFTRVNNDLRITVNSTGKTITVGNEFASTNHDGVQQIAFEDGTVWNRSQIQFQAAYRAGPGDVTVTAQNGDATLVAGTGNDTLVGGDINNNASDAFVYGSVDGNLTIQAHVYPWNVLNNTLQLTDLNAADLIATRVNNDLSLTVKSTGKVISVPGEFLSTNHDGIQQIAFADGSVWNGAQITAHAPYRAGPGDLTMTLADGDVAFAAGAGNDTVIAGDMWNNASDTFFYSAANGNLDIEAHVYSWNAINNTLNLTDLAASDLTFTRVNNDLRIGVNATGRTVTVGNEFASTNHDGVQQIAFGDGTVWNRAQIATHSPFRAGPGDVTMNLPNGDIAFVAGTGNDTVFVGDGWNNASDMFFYASNDGNLDIEAHCYPWNALNDTLAFTDINASDVTLSRVNNDLKVTVNATGKVITVGNEFVSTNHDGIQQVAFADGTTWSRDQIETHAIVNHSPTNASLTGGTVAENSANGTVVGTVTGVDPDAGAVLSYALTADANGRFAIGASTGQITVANGALLDYESATSHGIAVRVTDQGGLTFDKAFTIGVTDVNEAPTNATLSGGTVAENSANGTVVGTVTGVDPDAGAVLSYALTADANGRFAIGASTGQITVANGALLDYESATSHGITVRVTDQGGLTFDKAFTIGVTDVNEAPTNATLSGGTVAESSPNGTVVGTVTGVDADAGAALSYALTADANGRFAIDATTGQVTVANGALLDYESATSHGIAVRVTDQGGLTFDKAFTIGVTDVNEAPTNATLSGGTVAENSANGTVVGTVTGADPDAGAILSYSLVNNAGGRFAIGTSTGQITVANGALLDYESAASHGITVRVTDQGGLTFDKAFTIGVTDVNEAPTNATLSGGTVAENSANGTLVGTVTGVDPDAGAVLSYALTADANGRFAIGASTGQITVANGALLDYESATSHGITVRVTDQGGLTFDKAFTIGVTDVNEAPTNATLSGGTVAENSPNGTLVGTVTGVDPDAGSVLSYALVDNAGGRFAVGASTGQITVANGALLDYESATSHGIAVRVTDQGGLTSDKAFTIAITNVNEAPTNATLTGGSVAENSSNGTLVGTVTGADPDAGAILSYSLVNNAGGRFAIGTSTGQITVANGALLDYESATSHGIAVRVTDQGGLTFDKAFTIGVTDVNEAPSNATLSGGTVAENSANGTLVGTVTGVDPDAGSVLSYALVDNAGGRFAIGTSTGQITVANGALLDYESATTHAITVRVTDQGGLTFDKAFTIGVTDVNEAPSNATLSGGTVAENSANGTLVGTVTGVDPDAGSVLSYALVDNAGGRFAVGASTGQITVANGALLDYESATSHGIAVRVTDQGGLTSDKAFTIAITNVNEAPTNATLTGGSVAENSSNGTLVGTVTGADPDAGAILSYSLVNNAGGRFAIGTSTGQITVANGALLDYESATSHGIAVRVTDQGGLTFDKAFTIAVTNVVGVTLTGTSGADTLNGTGEEDTLQGLAGNDTLNGGAGNDTLDGGAGADTMSGGTGDDTFIVDSTSDVVTENANEGNDTVRTSLASYTLPASVENLVGTATTAQTLTGNALANAITGGGGNDTLNGGAGNDVLDGGAGNDILIGGAGADMLIGGAGTDTASYSTSTAAVTANLTSVAGNTGDAAGDTYSGIENLTGGSGDDTLTGDASANVIDGGAGNDILIGGAGADALTGGAGIDTASYTTAAAGVIANLTTPASNTGEAAGDTYTTIENLTGSAFADTLTGDANANVLDGGAGDDTLIGGAGADTLIGGAGIDTASYSTATKAVTANLATPASNLGDAAGDTYSGIENLTGGSAADTLTGDNNGNVLSGVAGNDNLSGGGGNDILIGGTGADVLNGGAGVDTASYATATAGVTVNMTTPAQNTGDASGDTYLGIENLLGSAFADTLRGDANANVIEGGAGNDTLTGNAGNDTFVFHSGFGFDSISDFAAGPDIGDVIQVDTSLFADFAAIQSHAAQVGLNTVITYDPGNTITLTGLSLSSLNANDFSFV
jgi:Ca2+-binding RTX toxin-like protein